MKYKDNDGKTAVGPQPKHRRMILDGETGAGAHDDTLPLRKKGSDEVSDGGSDFSVDPHDAEDIIEDGHGVIPRPKDSNPTAFDSLILDEYCEEEITPSLLPIDDKLSAVVTKWLRIRPPREKIKKMFKECMLPSNVEGLKPIRINAIVYNRLSTEMKQNDQKLRSLNTFLARGLGPILSIWNNMLKWEAAISEQSNPDVKASMGVIESGDLSLDVTEVRRQLDRSIRLLASAHSVLIDRRRQSLRHLFDNKFAYLFKDSNPATLELLGDNVDQKVVESVKLSEASQKLHFARSSSRGRGRFNNNYRRSQGRSFRRGQSSRHDVRRSNYVNHVGSNHQQNYYNQSRNTNSRSRGRGCGGWGSQRFNRGR